MATRIESNMHEVSILMKRSGIGLPEVHSAYSNQVDAHLAAKVYKRDDELSGDNFTRYWVIDVPVENEAPQGEI